MNRFRSFYGGKINAPVTYRGTESNAAWSASQNTVHVSKVTDAQLAFGLEYVKSFPIERKVIRHRLDPRALAPYGEATKAKKVSEHRLPEKHPHTRWGWALGCGGTC